MYLLRKAMKFCVRSTKEIVGTMPVQNLWWPRRFVTVFIGWRLMLLPRAWLKDVMAVKNSHGVFMYQLKN